VIPLFLKQRSTGTVTLTDERMTRFWLTLEQGVRFVIRCIECMGGGEVFVPKIPSMKITDLKEAVAPECATRVVGIRPGEKLHEALISDDEVRHTVELKDMFIIEPELASWDVKDHKGKPLPEGFRYTSDTNTEWLTVEQLKMMLP